MAKNYGTGISRVLEAAERQFTNVIFQRGKPPLDSEFVLLSDIALDARQTLLSQSTPSGWLGTGIQDHDAFITNAAWSNWFRFGQQRSGEQKAIQWAVVNGWMIPVTGTQTGTPPGSPNNSDTWNRITLSPPPSSSGGGRVDFIFLEAWQARLPPNPSTLNKPSSSALYRYGNVESGYSFLADDMIDADLGFETTQRVQVQYRVRVVTGLVGLQSFPDGFDPANVKGRGAASADTSFAFTNMRQTLGDPGLWRAGDGTSNALGTVDGYTYAIPLCAVFRRNSVAWDGDPGQNLNGGFNRNPTAIDRTGWKTFSTTPTLASSMSASQTTLTLVSATNIPLPTTPATPVYIKVGDEVMTYSVITGVTATVLRGQLGSKAEAHPSGAVVRLLAGRPDELFADQIASTDVLDLRHIVNPNGFDYTSLLDAGLKQLMRGELRSNWKRSGAGPQGAFVAYQDKISSSSAALGVTKLDSPDGIRQVWSDASYLQPVDFIAIPPSSRSAGTQNFATVSGWAFSSLTGSIDTSAAPTGSNVFKPGDVITIPIAQFNTALGSDGDQVQFPAIAASAQPVVSLRLAGAAASLAVTTDFTVTTPSGPSSNLVITLAATFNGSAASSSNQALFIRFHVQYGAGRGLSRRPDSVHSVAHLNSTPLTLTRQQGVPANNISMTAGWAALWSKFRSGMFAGQVPVTAESYVDPGSKTIVLSPFRQLGLPTLNTPVFRATRDSTPTLNGGLGLMPNPANKWGARTDPLSLFSTGLDPTLAKKNTYFVLPRNLMPGWGAVHVPILHTDTGTLIEGINFGFNAPKGAIASDNTGRDIIAYSGDTKSFSTFSTVVLSTVGTTNTPATFNAIQVTPIQNALPAGARFFTDSRGLGRKGLELPPFYGIARLFAVYEAQDFVTNGSAYDDTTRAAASGTNATNLLRQDLGNEPAFWIEIDSDGDSTFILNANALDLSKSPTTISSFESAHYVIESSIFGFDRNAFNVEHECRIVLCRQRDHALDPAGADPELPTDDTKLVVPGPPEQADSIAINYSRTPYQGDAWGSQLNQQDIGQALGVLTSGNASQIGFTELTETSLARPNQKVVQVLASKGFMTTLGTGRIAGDFSSTNGALDFRSAGYENVAAYPPSSPVAARPTYSYGALSSADDALSVGTTYHGCIEQLPLGALFRSKDFRGDAIDAEAGAIGLLFRDPSLGQLTNVLRTSTLEQAALPVFTSVAGSGGPGEILVHVDGETGNMSLLTNYRTTRGGSAFVASQPYPGGELAGAFARVSPSATGNAILCGIAYLVRNTVTSIGSSEVSAGGELMLLIATTAIRRHASATIPAFVFCGTQGSGEGFSAVDLYRLSGRPLGNDGVRLNIDPSAIVLGHKVSLKPRIGG